MYYNIASTAATTQLFHNPATKQIHDFLYMQGCERLQLALPHYCQSTHWQTVETPKIKDELCKKFAHHEIHCMSQVGKSNVRVYISFTWAFVAELVKLKILKSPSIQSTPKHN